MPPVLIRETPVLVWDAGEAHTVRVALTPRAGLGLDDYGTFTLTVRADPDWPRSGAGRVALETADPIADDWTVGASGSATAAAPAIEVAIDVTVPDGPGFRRYVGDDVAEGGAAGRVTVVPLTWLSVRPTARAPA